MTKQEIIQALLSGKAVTINNTILYLPEGSIEYRELENAVMMVMNREVCSVSA